MSLDPKLATLATIIEQNPQAFVATNPDVRTTALDAAKFVFDLSIISEQESKHHISSLLSSLSPFHAPTTRSQTRKRKRSPIQNKPTFQTTPLTSLFIEGMSEDQVWEQLDLRNKNICQMLELILDGPGEDEDPESSTERLRHALELDNFPDEMDSDSDSSDEDDDDGDDEIDDTGSESGGAEDNMTEDVMGLRDSPSSEDGDQNELPSVTDVMSKCNISLAKSQRSHGPLDDGFFNLASFNAETERAEAKTSSRGHLGEDSDSDSDDISVDLFAPLDHSGHSEDAEIEDAGEVFYHDFFDPPPRASLSKTKAAAHKKSFPDSSGHGQVRFHDEVKVLKIKPRGKNVPLEREDDDDDADDDDDIVDNAIIEQGGSLQEFNYQGIESSFDAAIDDVDNGEDGEDRGGQHTIDRLKDDLFAEEEDLQQDLSTHEKRMTSLHKEIKQLESENVGPKDWVLTGEAGSRTRPKNSLLEEDLEFERVTKAIPVVTEEVVQALEERIKARIIEGRFDDVIRIRAMDDKPFLPSRFFELRDTKSTQSLAQIYENEFVAGQAGDVAGDDRDGKLKKEHAEVEKLWETICGKLDALSNAHFVPKQPKVTISTISNVPTATLESALPTTKSTVTMLAPEEVFAPLSTEPRARSEMTPVEKRALRGRERKSRKKARDVLNKVIDKFAKNRSTSMPKHAKHKQAASKGVVKDGKGVTVIGKKARTH